MVISPDPTVVSGCLLALVKLLRPLHWAGNVVVTLPGFLNELLESPSFFFLGMGALPEGFELSQSLVVVDPHDHCVHLHPTDIVQSHTINVPQSPRLLAALRKPTESILQVCIYICVCVCVNRSMSLSLSVCVPLPSLSLSL